MTAPKLPSTATRTPRPPAYIPLGAGVGAAIGAGLGVVFDALPILTPAGVAIGVGFGVIATRLAARRRREG